MNTMTQIMTDDDIRRVAPSVFATRPWYAMSAKYAFIPTSEVVSKLRSEGFQAVRAEQSRARIEGKGCYTKHMLRFRDMRRGDAPITSQLGTLYPEIVLTNSHDGASAYRLDAGLFRVVCMNGMVVGCTVGDQIAIHHKGGAAGVIEATYEVVNRFPSMIREVGVFQRTQLTPEQSLAFADAALDLKFDSEEDRPTHAAANLIAPVRAADRGGTLWNALNVIQEKMIGGVGTRLGRNPRTGRRVTMRGTTGISEANRMNKALWTLARKMSELVN